MKTGNRALRLVLIVVAVLAASAGVSLATTRAVVESSVIEA
jgi:hypothetical protein